MLCNWPVSEWNEKKKEFELHVPRSSHSLRSRHDQTKCTCCFHIQMKHGFWDEKLSYGWSQNSFSVCTCNMCGSESYLERFVGKNNNNLPRQKGVGPEPFSWHSQRLPFDPITSAIDAARPSPYPQPFPKGQFVYLLMFFWVVIFWCYEWVSEWGYSNTTYTRCPLCDRA